MNPNIKKLEQLVKVLDSYGAVTKEEQLGFMQDVINVLAQFKSATSQINQETKDTLNLIVKQVNAEHTRILNNVSRETEGVKQEMSAELKDVLDRVNTVAKEILTKTPKDGKDGIDGKDADEEKIIEEVLKKVQVPEVNLDPLKEEIDSKFSKVYDHIKKSVNGFPGVRLLSNLMDVVLSSPTNGQGLVYDSTLGKWKNGTISASANIEVKDEGSTLTSSVASLNFVGSGVTATNVGNDVTVTISTGSATPAGSDTQVQFNDGGSFGADAHFTYDKTNDVLHVHKIAGDATDGLLIESANGTDIGILGAANTANATWYGTHNFPATGLQIGSSNPFTDSAGTLTLQNVDVLDATTETTIENALDTLPNVTSIQGRTVTLADAGANAIFGWDDTAGAYENLTASEATATLNAFVGDSGSGGTKGLVPAPSAGDSGKYLKGDGTWATITGGGDVYKVGTPVNNQIGVWTGDGTIEGDSALTFDTSTDTLTVGTTLGYITSGTNLTLRSGSNGQDIYVEGSNASTAGSPGGWVYLTGGNGNTTGNGGTTEISAGHGGASGSGGGTNLYAGDGGGTSGNGGTVEIGAGSANGGNGNGGSVEIFAGVKSGSGTNGLFRMYQNDGLYKFSPDGSFSNFGVLDFSDMTTSDKTFTFPNATGTIALTSDIIPISYLDTDTTLAANSDAKVATQKATKTYVDARVAQTITNGVTTSAPSQDAVFDALALKLDATAYDDATAAETTTGTSTTKYVSPDGLAGSEFGKRTVSILVSDPNGDAITTGDGKAVFPVDTTLNGMNLVAVKGYLSTVSSSGAPNVQIRRSRRSSATARTTADMLSTALTIDASEFESADAATAAVINTSNDDVQTGDMLFIDIDGAGTGAKGLQVLLTFQLP